jgi:hypothetical protein
VPGQGPATWTSSASWGMFSPFDGINENGERLRSGVYFYRIEAGEGVETGRFVIAR